MYRGERCTSEGQKEDIKDWHLDFLPRSRFVCIRGRRGEFEALRVCLLRVGNAKIAVRFAHDSGSVYAESAHVPTSPHSHVKNLEGDL